MAWDFCYRRDFADTLEQLAKVQELRLGEAWWLGGVYSRKDFASTLEQLAKV